MPYSENDLEKRGIVQWEWIADGFDNADIFLGNGFSINLCERLSYRSLFNQFIETCDPESRRIFNEFGTTNFELIIQILNNAERVNEILKLPTNTIEPIRNNLRQGLISTIQANHPTHAEIYYPQLIAISKDLEEFQDIYTTNYDVFTYKIILQSITEARLKGLGDTYQDYFYQEISPTELGFNYERVFNDARSIYYLHGALFIYQTNGGTNYKLRRLEQLRMEYIQLIRREIENDNFPIFVAEGDSMDKLRTINNNVYLNFCARNLSQVTRNLVFYGFSFGKSDSHIVDLVSKSNSQRIAISIWKGNKTLDELEAEASRFRTTFLKKEVLVYDSESIFPTLRPY